MYRKILVGGVTAAVVLGSGTAALALGSSGDTTSGSPSAAPSSSTSTPAHSGKSKDGKAGSDGKKDGRGRLLRHAAHAQITTKGKNGFVTRDLIAGTVTSVSATSITVQAADKTSETFSVTKDTKVVVRTKGAAKGTKPASSTISKIAKGQRVFVEGTGASSRTAEHVVGLPAK